MANINDFKILSSHSRGYFKYLHTDEEDKITQARLGFYLFALECITGVSDIEALKAMINDTEFLKVVYQKTNIDLGIDAVHIDIEKNQILLFNFKYRQNFNEDKAQSENDIFQSSKLLTLLNDGVANLDELTETTRGFVQQIRECMLETEEVWELKLCMVSNENQSFNADSSAINSLKSIYGLEIESYTLKDFSNFIIKRRSDSEAVLLLSKSDIFSYVEEDLASAKSYLMKMKLSDLIRITGSDNDYRMNYNSETDEKLKDATLDYSVLFDNVRGYLGDTPFNKNMFNTIENEPTKFFMYNNGITMTADDIRADQVNGNTKMKITIKNHQVVNGGQTLRTIFKFKDMNFDEEKLQRACVLVRMFKTDSESQMVNRIAEYTNSQNAISAIDLKSVDLLQIQIETFLSSKGILYTRKVGDIGDITIDYSSRISMERFGQILYSSQGYPDRASNQKKRIFEQYYNDVFGENNFDLEKSEILINRYNEIIRAYDSCQYPKSEQKIFYAIYLSRYIENIDQIIELIEETLNNYKKKEEISPARKLIQKGFMNELKDTLKRNNIVADNGSPM